MDDDDAPPFAYTIYDRCIAEGRAARSAGVSWADCPYAHESGVDFEREAWLDGWGSE